MFAYRREVRMHRREMREERRACRDAEPHKCAHAKYYQHANLQSWFLEGVFMERNFAVCAMERAYATVRELLATAVRDGSDAEPAALAG